MIVKWIVIVLFMVTFFGQPSCSFVVPGSQQITITTSEDDAIIYANGVLVGRGTAMTSVPRNKTLAVVVRKDGFFPAMRTVSTSLSSTGVLDLIGGVILLVPFIGLMAPGAYELDQDNIALVLIEKDQ